MGGILQSILNDIKRNLLFKRNIVTNIILLNIAVFALLNIIHVFVKNTDDGEGLYFNTLLKFVGMSTRPELLMTRPWTLVTSGFVHEAFFHLLWNMLAIYWFGMLASMTLNKKGILILCIGSIVFGNLLFFATHNIFFSGDNFCIGASGVAMGFLGYAVYNHPDYQFVLLIFGPTKLKFLALVMLFIDCLAIFGNDQMVGHVANFGGFIFGILFALYSRRNRFYAH